MKTKLRSQHFHACFNLMILQARSNFCMPFLHAPPPCSSILGPGRGAKSTMFPSAKSEGSVWSDGAVSERAASGGPSDGASDADGDNGDSDANGAGDGGGVDGDGDGGGGGGGGGGDADGGDGDDGQGDGGGGGGDGGGGDGGDGDSGGTYKFPAFTPLSEERVKIVHDEIRQISHRAKEALEEVGGKSSHIRQITI